MGNISSSKWKEILDSYREQKDESGDNNDTTPKSNKNFRGLRIDPRSPSGNVSRTPIQVEKTPTGSLENTLNSSEDGYSPVSPPALNLNINNDIPKNCNEKKCFKENGRDRPRSPLKTIYGTRVGSPFSYLRHKQVQSLKSELRKHDRADDRTSSIASDSF